MTTEPSAPFSELALVAQVVDYAILALDPFGVITTWNAGAEHLKGYSADEAIGHHFSMFYGDEDRRSGLPVRLLEEARDKGRVEHSGWRVRKDGSRFWADVVITALRDPQGDLVGYAKVTRDMTDQHRLASSLRASEERLRLLVSQVVDYAILGLDLYGVIVSWNAGAERLKGYTADEALGRHFSMFYTAEDQRSGLPLELLRRARDEGRVEDTGWRVRKDGTTFWGDVVITALHDAGGELTGYAKVTRDLTDQHRAEEMQASLFATISHDLRAPLHNIDAYAALLPDSEPADQAHFAERIIDNAEQLERLVTGMFDYAKLRAGAVPITIEPLPLGPLLAGVLTDHERALGDRPVTSPNDTAPTVLADRAAMRRVLDNLLTNAVKYSPPGSPIEITSDRTGGRVRLVVADHGRGIDPADLPLLMTEFVRGRLAQDDGGTGLGLASVRRLMHLQHGEATIESTLGVGTRVVLDLPAAG